MPTMRRRPASGSVSLVLAGFLDASPLLMLTPAVSAAQTNVPAHPVLLSTAKSTDGEIRTAGEVAGSAASVQCTDVHPSCTETGGECRCCIDVGALVAFEYCAYWTPCTGQTVCVWASTLPPGATFPQASGACEACSTFWWIPLQPGSYTAILKGGEFCGAAQVSETVRFTVVNSGGCCSDNDCGDANPCTTDRCTSGTCTHTPNTSSCNDGLFCNGSDTCRDATCSVHSGNPCLGRPECADTCNEAADNCFDQAGTPCADDGNPCTNDTCNGSGACAHPSRPQGTACDDGLFCNGSDQCNGAGACGHSGNSCLDGLECADACNEAAETCFDPAGTACGDASDIGCDAPDTCDGAGTCVDREDVPGTSCDDGLFCNGADTCDGGGACIHLGNPCLDEEHCSEAAGRCVCLADQECDDLLDCTTDTCDARVIEDNQKRSTKTRKTPRATVQTGRACGCFELVV